MEFISHERHISKAEADELDFLGQAVIFKNPHTGLCSVTVRRENWNDEGARVLDRHSYLLKV